METEYIRGKHQERNGALSARAPAKFDKRGNDVWAERSGRVYQPSGMEGGAKDYSSPVTGNGMGNLSRLVGGRRKRGGVKARYGRNATEEEQALQTEESEHQQARMLAGLSPTEPGLSLNEMRDRQHELQQAEYDKSHPIMGIFNKLGKAVPGFARGLAKYAGDAGAVSKPFAMGLTGLANYLEKNASARARHFGEPGGSGKGGSHCIGSAKPFRMMVGGSEFSINPLEAQQIVAMDYRGGKHPYLTKTGRERKHIKGSGIMDALSKYAGKIGHELADPDSDLRGKYVSQAANLAAQAAPLLNAYKPGLGDTVRTGAQGVNTANRAASAAQHLLPGTGYTDFNRGVREAQAVAPDVMNEYNQFNRARTAFPRPNLQANRRPAMGRDGLGRALAPVNREPEARRQLRAPVVREPLQMSDFTNRYDTRRVPRPRAQLQLGDREPLLAIEDAPRRGNYYADLDRFDGMTGLGKGKARKPNARAAIVRKLMAERGLSMIEASKAVKAEGLY